MPMSVSAAVDGPAAAVVWTRSAAARGLADYGGLSGWSAWDRDAVAKSVGGFGAVGASCV
jgi:hypothetical protein